MCSVARQMESTFLISFCRNYIRLLLDLAFTNVAGRHKDQAWYGREVGVFVQGYEIRQSGYVATRISKTHQDRAVRRGIASPGGRPGRPRHTAGAACFYLV